MPRVHHVKSARKAHGDTIAVGDSYYWWKFRYGPKRVSKVPPTRSQLTQSAFLSELWSIEDNLSGYFSEVDDPESLADAIQSLVDDIQNLLDECQSNLDNMPEHLQDTSDAGELLRERIDGLEEWISNLESIDTSIDTDNLTTVDRQEEINNLIEEAQSYDSGL